MWAVRGSEQVRYLYTTGNTCISNIVPKFKKKECFNKTHSSLLSVCRFSNSVFKFKKILRYRYFLNDTK